MITVFPSRNTFALGAESFFRLFRDFAALTVCTVPRMALRVITAIITTVLSTSPSIAETTAAAISIISL